MAHHVNATFGDVTVVPVVSDTIAPVISDIQVTPADTAAAITWTTNEPATSTVAYGQTTAYEGGIVNDDTLVTEHTIVLTDLISDTLYHYQVSSADGSGNVASSTDLTFTTTSSGGPGLPGIVSDDFNACILDEGLWEFIDPLEDATLAMTGTHVSISVPDGPSHDIWGTGPGDFANHAARVMQPAADTDFELEVKFDSGVGQMYQTQGVLIEQDPNDLLRLEFLGKNSKTHIFAAKIENGQASNIGGVGLEIADGNVAPLYMRVKRAGSQWTQSYSFNGADWTTYVLSYTHPMTITAVGTYAGNAGTTPSNAPAHTAVIDYFYNMANPGPGDIDENTLTVGVNPVGSGTVYTDPVKSTYSCGEVVTLTATANTGWTFDGWSGDLSDVTDPVTETITVTMTGSRVITATFTQDGSQVFLPIITRQYSP